MAGAAGDILDPQIGGAGADRDAVVPGADDRVRDGDGRGELDVDPVGVGAVFRRRYFEALQLHVLASVYHNVEHFAI